MKELWRRLKWFLHRDAFERELDEEMRHHLALKAEERGSAKIALLFGLKPNDPWTLGSAVAILTACAIVAGYAPAWRAACVDPASALRHE